MTTYGPKGALVEVSADTQTPVFTPAGQCLVSVTDPPFERNSVPQDCLDDAKIKSLPGLEQESQFLFTHGWDPDSAESAILAGLAQSGDDAAWRVTYKSGGTTLTGEFQGWVSGLIPQEVSGTSPKNRQVRVQKTTDITWASV